MPFTLDLDTDAARVVETWNRLHRQLPERADEISRQVTAEMHDAMEADLRKTLRLSDNTFFTGRKSASGRGYASRRRGRLFQRDFSIYFGFNPIPVEWPQGNVVVGHPGTDLFLNTQRHVSVLGVVGDLTGEIPHSWFFRGPRGALAGHRGLPGLPVERYEFGNERLFQPDPDTRSRFQRITTGIEDEAQQVVNRTLRRARVVLEARTRDELDRLIEGQDGRRAR